MDSLTDRLSDRTLAEPLKNTLRIPYALRRVPAAALSCLLPLPAAPAARALAVAQLEKIGKNARLELVDGRNATLHEGDLLAVVFGNRYATQQFEGYARANGAACDLLSMGGLCGTVASKHASVAEPTRLRLLGTLGDAAGRPLSLRDFALPAIAVVRRPEVIVVCGASMDSGKTHTASRLIHGLHRHGESVAGIKLTGTAAGRDTWSLLDAGAAPALDFIDGGFPSTYLCSLEELLDLHELLLAHAAAGGAVRVVIEIADGLLERETGLLLRSTAFVKTVDHWLFTAGDPLAAVGGVTLLRSWGIEPDAISGVISMSPLAMREAHVATGVRCVTAGELARGELNAALNGRLTPPIHAAPRAAEYMEVPV